MLITTQPSKPHSLRFTVAANENKMLILCILFKLVNSQYYFEKFTKLNSPSTLNTFLFSHCTLPKVPLPILEPKVIHLSAQVLKKRKKHLWVGHVWSFTCLLLHLQRSHDFQIIPEFRCILLGRKPFRIQSIPSFRYL